MTATATETGLGRKPRLHWPQVDWPWPVLLVLGLFLGGCAEEPLPKPPLSRDDCLRMLSLDTLDERLKACDAVVAAFPRDPYPLNDRYLLHSLAGNDRAACADLHKAINLAGAIPAEQLDQQLRLDLEVRRQLCNGKPDSSAAGQP